MTTPSGAMRALVLAALIPALAACVSVTREPRALSLQVDGSAKAQTLACLEATRRAERAPEAPALDPAAIRVVTWNIHKEADSGWDRDLARFVKDNDLVLLQEATLVPALRAVIERPGMTWTMASSFSRDDRDIGVLTAGVVTPVSRCTARIDEPLLRLPKSAVVTWFPLAGTDATLAVVNVHAINFSLSLGAYREQMAALGEALAAHRGPIVFAGDMNTWTDARRQAVEDVTRHLGLTEVTFRDDKRKLFFGHELDHIYVRGLDLVQSTALPVTSSDHNPVFATLRLAPAAAAVASTASLH